MLTIVIGTAAIALLYRQIRVIGKLMILLWAGMLLTVGSVIVSGVIHLVRFGAGPALDFPPDAFHLSTGFALGSAGPC